MRILCRSFGTYESKLWDDIFSEFEPITSDDIILVNFAAWYPKYKITEPYVPYQQWEEDMAGDSHAHIVDQTPSLAPFIAGEAQGNSIAGKLFMDERAWQTFGWSQQILLCEPPATT